MKTKAKLTYNELSTGSILLSEPYLQDPFFKRTVILLCEHNDEGSVGFILNKKTDLNLNDVLNGFEDFNPTIYFGGPVDTDTLHYVHRLGHLIPGSKEIMDGIYWGGDFEALKLLINTKRITENDVRFFIGYSGWDYLQLNQEYVAGNWIMSTADEELIFKNSAKTLWSSSLKALGDTFSVIATLPDEPFMN